MKTFAKTSLFVGLFMIVFPEPALAQEACLQNLSRVKACPNLVYRGVTEPTTNERVMFCFCKSDFQLLLNENVNDRQKMLNKMDWQALLVATGYSDQELRQLVKP